MNLQGFLVVSGSVGMQIASNPPLSPLIRGAGVYTAKPNLLGLELRRLLFLKLTPMVHTTTHMDDESPYYEPEQLKLTVHRALTYICCDKDSVENISLLLSRGFVDNGIVNNKGAGGAAVQIDGFGCTEFNKNTGEFVER